ncbi:MAG: 50S ribosomal protein L10 [Candidatus Aenigmatarchaeota archaeon]
MTKRQGEKKEKREVKKQKLDAVKQIAADLKGHPVIGIINMYKMPARQMQKIRKELAGKAKIRTAKKSTMLFAIKEAGMDKLEPFIVSQPAILFTEMNPFKISFFLQKNKSSVAAKVGDITPKEIVVSAGPTDIPPGPAITTLSKVKVPAKVEGGKIAVIKDVTVAKAGDKLSADLVAALNLLKMEPMELGINLVALYENGLVYGKDVLSVTQEQYLENLARAHMSAFNLSVNAVIPLKETVGAILAKAQLQAKALATAAKLE